MDNINFSKDLIKGKIVETIFQQMFRENESYTILPFGYEHTTPELAQYQRKIALKKVLQNIRHAPDFILISQDKKEVYLVEVKYRSRLEAHYIKKIVEETLRLWDPSYLFVATPQGFFFGPCNEIFNKDGEIGPLYQKWVNKEVQEKYLNLMNEFIGNIDARVSSDSSNDLTLGEGYELGLI